MPLEPILLANYTLIYSFNKISLSRFLYYSSSWGMSPEAFDNLLTKYIESVVQKDEITTYIREIVRMSDNPGPKEQFFALGTISNYHWKGNPSEKDPKKKTTPKIPYASHMLNTPNTKYQPSSPQNPLMMYHKQENDVKLSEYLNYMKFIYSEEITEDQQMLEPQPKQCKLTARANKVQKEKVIKRSNKSLMNVSELKLKKFSTHMTLGQGQLIT